MASEFALISNCVTLSGRLFEYRSRFIIHSGQKIDDVQLKSPQFAVLHVLTHEQPLDQRTIGLRSSLDRSTVADIVSRLVRRGLIESSDDPNDGRRKWIMRSELGRRIHQSAAVSALEINESLLFPVSTSEQLSLLAILNKIVHYHENCRQDRVTNGM